MDLAAKAVQFRFHRTWADLLDDVLRLGDPLAQGHADGISDLDVNRSDSLTSSFASDLSHAAEIRTEIVGSLEVHF